MTNYKKNTVLLSSLTEADKHIMFEWINDKRLVEFNSFFKPVSWPDHCNWFDNIQRDKTVRVFAIRETKENKLLGSCQLNHIDNIVRSAELQIRIGDFAEMGKGLGTQAVKLLLKIGFEALGLQRIYLNVFSDNTRAYKSYLKSGFKEEGLLRRAAFVGNELKDVKIMSILNEEFKS